MNDSTSPQVTEDAVLNVLGHRVKLSNIKNARLRQVMLRRVVARPDAYKEAYTETHRESHYNDQHSESHYDNFPTPSYYDSDGGS